MAIWEGTGFKRSCFVISFRVSTSSVRPAGRLNAGRQKRKREKPKLRRTLLLQLLLDDGGVLYFNTFNSSKGDDHNP